MPVAIRRAAVKSPSRSRWRPRSVCTSAAHGRSAATTTPWSARSRTRSTCRITSRSSLRVRSPRPTNISVLTNASGGKPQQLPAAERHGYEHRQPRHRRQGGDRRRRSSRWPRSACSSSACSPWPASRSLRSGACERSACSRRSVPTIARCGSSCSPTAPRSGSRPRSPAECIGFIVWLCRLPSGPIGGRPPHQPLRPSVVRSGRSVSSSRSSPR